MIVIKLEILSFIYLLELLKKKMTNKDEGSPQELFFRISGTREGHWETDRPQPTIIKLVEQGVFHGQVLDIGCGIADNAIYIVTHTNNVNITVIDLVNSQLFYLFKLNKIFYRYLKQLKWLVKKLKKLTSIFNLKLLIYLMIFQKQI